MNMKATHFFAAAAVLAMGANLFAATDLIDTSWQHTAPREEIAPRFSYEPKGGHGGGNSVVIETDQREGLSGHWFKTVPVQGAQHYRFAAWRQAEGLPSARRNAVARILWQDSDGKPV